MSSSSLPHRFRAFAAVLVLPLFSVSGCISVNLNKDTPKSKGLVVSAPASPFRDISLPAADRAWKSDRTGSTISYFSECQASLASPERLRDDALASLPGAKVIDSQSFDFDGREALRSSAEGKVEGVSVKLSLLTYQKNGCRYTLSFVARANVYNQELLIFEGFIKGFSAP
ncbi:MAG: hypothetical protein ACK5P7_10405 [Bdellovibrio sp.]|jgi:hypothetical protein